MPTFSYKGVKKGGEKAEGSLEAANRKAATKMLLAKGIRVVSIKESGGAKKAVGIKKRGKKEGGKPLFRRRKPITEPFLAKLLQLHQSGMPIGDAIKSLKERLTDPDQKALAQQLWQDLSEGRTLAMAMKRFPEIFDNTVVYAVEAGEASGNLGPILTNVVEHLRSQAELKKTIASGLAYPIFVSCIAIAVVGLFLFYLLPRIQSMMSSMGGKMTLSARLLIGSADAVIYVGPVVAVILIIVTLVIRNWRKSDEGLRKTDMWLLKIPFIGGLVGKAAYSQTANLLATLLESGVNTTEAMRLTEKLITNRVLFERFQASQKQINDGVAISSSFKQTEFFPDLAIDILSVGENTGNMVHSFKEIYGIYSKELEADLKKLTTFISSAALLFAFVLVSILAMSIVTSVLQFSNSLVK